MKSNPDTLEMIQLIEDFEEPPFQKELPQVLKKPVARVIGQNGNVFNLIGICSRVLKKNNMSKEAKEMTERCFKSSSYGEALSIMAEYCNLK